jgi:hypothetical protein
MRVKVRLRSGWLVRQEQLQSFMVGTSGRMIVYVRGKRGGGKWWVYPAELYSRTDSRSAWF